MEIDTPNKEADLNLKQSFCNVFRIIHKNRFGSIEFQIN